MISDEDLLKRVKRDYKESDDHTSDWRLEARQLYDLVAGHQWDEVDEARMREELRPVVTFNVAGKFIDAISGLQINNRQQIKYLPREMGDVRVNEILTGAADWARQECDAEDEETDAFLDMLICGLGAVETSISFEDDPEGQIAVERRDPLEMYWDVRARKRNHRDGRWRMRVPLMTEEQIVERWGQDKYDQIAGTMGIDVDYPEGEIHNATEAWKYEHDQGHSMGNVPMTPVVHYEWFERADMIDLQSQFGRKNVTPGQWRKLKPMFEERGIQHRAIKIRDKKYFRGFVAGNVVLDKSESPYQEGFTIKLITGKRDRNRGTWYGVGRAIRDPQLWTNKFFSQILHVINTNAKGGLLAEESAFADPRKAEADWAKPDSITYTEDGAVSGGKIMPKPEARYPQGMDRLMQFSVEALPQTSGLNLEMIGMADRIQPGIVEAHRKQSAMTVIAWAFDAMRRYYKDHGRCLAYYIREYISDGRLVRILGQDGNEKYIPLVRDQLTYQYDVIVDESPSSPNMKERVWAVLTEMLPTLMKAGAPIPPEALDYSPLPADLVDKWKRQISSPEAQQARQREQQIQAEHQQAETEETESKTVLNLAKAREAAADAGRKAAGG